MNSVLIPVYLLYAELELFCVSSVRLQIMIFIKTLS